ncbi:PHP domain-containing protein [Rhodococcus sp. X156]|uniref:PHP domain-containing protein n=1 Tax=Rhodococcus sp. X156 TaxID=2499145 RepID=UPI000FD8E694|nr:PHP domain-containing protein [Rhodococcus sp. X156]
MGHEHGSAHGHSHTHGHSQTHGHGHPHSHSHDNPDSEPLPPALDPAVPTSELPPAAVDRRRFLRSAGLLGAGAAVLGVTASTGIGSAAASPLGGRGSGRVPRGGYTWLAGDHHIHTQFSSDGQYRVIDQVRHANAYGLDWVVITDHGSEVHARIGVEKVNPDIVAARRDTPDTLVFQGLEWNIPAAEHGTVFVHPGRNEVAVLKQFEVDYDGSPLATAALNEQRAIQGLHFLAGSVSRRRVQDALMLANHPARKGIDSPHEIRGWRDAEPRIAIGMEGAPGHQAAGMPKAYGPGGGRGYYDGSPGPGSFPGYPLESYRTFGGFDWMTSTVGGLWDSLLAEGKPWWISANSDSHSVYADTSVRGENTFATAGRYGEPTYRTAGPNLGSGDFWPGYYSRTHVGATDFSYAAVMDGLRAGRVWVDHGRLLESLDVRLRAGNREVPLGGMLTARRGSQVELVITVVPADTPNWSELLPRLAKIDVIRGAVTGPVGDRDVFTAPRTRVDQTFDVRGRTGEIRISYPLGRLDEAFYVRLRGSDGNRLAPGLLGAAVDPAGPAQDVVGDADPWQDLWFYTNPMWAIPA